MIARALMHEPQVLFLDEPSTGLDPQSRIFVHECVRELKDRGVTVVLTTHQMEEAAKLCDRVAIVDRGKLLALDAPAALVRELPGSTTLTLSLEFAESAESLPALAVMALGAFVGSAVGMVVGMVVGAAVSRCGSACWSWPSPARWWPKRACAASAAVPWIEKGGATDEPHLNRTNHCKQREKHS
ncbi:AAA family ATPase [Microtetraspora malaysiensis]|uniref:AAA family ATPase n=1 Tax=Microtetraspora malaysiensis TaxID=161358 RepID=UPI003D8E3D8D